MVKHNDNWLARLGLAAFCVAGLLAIVASQPGTADAGPLAKIVMPNNDGGIVIAPPAKINNVAQSPVVVNCGDNNTRSVLIQNQDADDDVRIGSNRVSGVVGKQNGIELKPGESITWGIGDQEAYVICENLTDAGCVLGVVCGAGGTFR